MVKTSIHLKDKLWFEFAGECKKRGLIASHIVQGLLEYRLETWAKKERLAESPPQK